MQLQIHMRKHIYLVNWRIYTALRGVWGVCVYVCVCVCGGGGGGGGVAALYLKRHFIMTIFLSVAQAIVTLSLAWLSNWTGIEIFCFVRRHYAYITLLE